MISFNSIVVIIILIASIIFIYFFYRDTRFIPIKKKTIKITENENVTHLYGFSSSYGVAVDKKDSIFIPDFNEGLIYKVDKYYENCSILKNYKNSLKEISFFEKLLLSTSLIKIFKISTSFRKPHDIYFDKDEKMYITQLGRGHRDGGGKVFMISKKNKLIKKIGKKDLVDPVMTYVDNNKHLYISESGSNNILKYYKNTFSNFMQIKKKKKINKSKNKTKKFIYDNLNGPHAFKIGPDGKYYIADTHNHRIVKYSKTRKFMGWIGKAKTGNINDNWSKRDQSIKGHELGAFNTPIDIFFKNKFMYVSDCYNNRIVKISMSGKSKSWLGKSTIQKENKIFWKNKGNSIPSKDAFGMHHPFGMKFFKDKLYIADKQNFRIKIIKSKNLF